MSVSRQERRQLERQEAKARRRQGIPSCQQPAKIVAKAFWLAPAILGVLCLIGAFVIVGRKNVVKSEPASESRTNAIQLPEITELVKMSDEELSKVGIARANLACAKGLGSNPMTDSEVAGCLANLQKMTAAVRLHTANNYYKLAKKPEEYENSEIYYKVAMLITVVEQNFGVRYNMAKAAMRPNPGEPDHFFDDPADVFVLGAFGIKKLGTCSSMPVACVAVGRELGYPLKLVSAKGHLFFRWDDGTQRMNFECTNRVNVYSDEEFKKWPVPISDDELADGLYLKNLTPRQELAVFLSIRGAVLSYYGRQDEAVSVVKQAYDLDPHPAYVAAGREYWKRRPVRVNMASNEDRARQEALDAVEAVYRQSMRRSREQQILRANA